MKQTLITPHDIECLEHMRNLGQLVDELMKVQRCKKRWLTGEDNV